MCCLITPVIKNKEKFQPNASIHGPVSVIWTVEKIFESCVVLAFIELKLTSHVNQFGLVKSGGCNKTLFAFTNTVTNIVKRQSYVYFCGLYAAKAFGHINNFYLFLCMVNRGIP